MKIKVLKAGIGTPVNKYEKPLFTGGAPKSAWHQFDEENPSLPAFYNNGTTPLPVGYEGECELVWQQRVNKDLVEAGIDKEIKWKNITIYNGMDTSLPYYRQIYLSPDAPESKDKGVTIRYTPAKVDIEQAAEERYPDGDSVLLNTVKLSERRAFVAGANHIKATHVPVEEVEEHFDVIISNIQSFLFKGDLDPDEDVYNQGLERGIKEINKIRQLIKTT